MSYGEIHFSAGYGRDFHDSKQKYDVRANFLEDGPKRTRYTLDDSRTSLTLRSTSYIHVRKHAAQYHKATKMQFLWCGEWYEADDLAGQAGVHSACVYSAYKDGSRVGGHYIDARREVSQ